MSGHTLSTSGQPRRSDRLRHKTDLSTQPLYCAIDPIRPVFHRFLSDDDAARLLRVARSFIAPILAAFTFHSHIFEPTTLLELARMKTVYEGNGLHVTQMGMPADVKQLQLDPMTGESPLPHSLLSLMLTQPMHDVFDSTKLEPRWATFSAAAADWHTRPAHCLPEADVAVERYRDLFAMVDGVWWYPLTFGDNLGEFDCTLPPGLLPHGLRVLQLNHAYNTAFLPGSLPDTLTYLQTGRSFSVPIAPGTLPSSLLYLSLDSSWNQPLEPGVLPDTLQYLYISACQTHPLQAGVLPASLLSLTLSTDCDQPLLPGVLPQSLLHLSIETRLDQTLEPGVLPSSLTSLRFGNQFDNPLLEGMLPASLRRLWLSPDFNQRLLPGQLNDGLLYLFFVPGSGTYEQQLEPGVLPSSLVALDLSDRYRRELREGVVPASVRWIGLHRCYETKVKAVLPAGVERFWWPS